MIEVQVVLGRVADGAVALERGARGQQGGRVGLRPSPSTRARRCRDRRPRSTPRRGTRAGGRTRARRARWRGGASRPGTIRPAPRTGGAPSRSRRSAPACDRPNRIAGRRFRTRRGRRRRAPTRRRPVPAFRAPRTGGRLPSTDGRATSVTSAALEAARGGEDHVGGVGPRDERLARGDGHAGAADER